MLPKRRRPRFYLGIHGLQARGFSTNDVEPGGRQISRESFAPPGLILKLARNPRACGAVAETQSSAIFPSSPRRGGRDLKKISRSLLFGADGVVIKFRRILLRLNTTPSARAKDASQRFFDRAATPPRRGGETRRTTIWATAPHGRGYILTALRAGMSVTLTGLKF